MGRRKKKNWGRFSSPNYANQYSIKLRSFSAGMSRKSHNRKTALVPITSILLRALFIVLFI